MNELNEFETIKAYLIKQNESEEKEMPSEMKTVIEQIVKALVDKPKDVKIEELNTSEMHVIEIKVHDDDIGKIIGKKGKIANSIRNIANAVAGKYNEKIFVAIIQKKIQPENVK